MVLPNCRPRSFGMYNYAFANIQNMPIIKDLLNQRLILATEKIGGTNLFEETIKKNAISTFTLLFKTYNCSEQEGCKLLDLALEKKAIDISLLLISTAGYRPINWTYQNIYHNIVENKKKIQLALNEYYFPRQYLVLASTFPRWSSDLQRLICCYLTPTIKAWLENTIYSDGLSVYEYDK